MKTHVNPILQHLKWYPHQVGLRHCLHRYQHLILHRFVHFDRSLGDFGDASLHLRTHLASDLGKSRNYFGDLCVTEDPELYSHETHQEVYLWADLHQVACRTSPNSSGSWCLWGPAWGFMKSVDHPKNSRDQPGTGRFTTGHFGRSFDLSLLEYLPCTSWRQMVVICQCGQMCYKDPLESIGTYWKAIQSKIQ